MGGGGRPALGVRVLVSAPAAVSNDRSTIDSRWLGAIAEPALTIRLDVMLFQR